MKLQINHLSPYLPYGLEFLLESEAGSKEPNINKMKSIHTGLNAVNYGWGNAKSLTDIKPILKSISDLDDIVIYAFHCYRHGKMHETELIDLFCFQNIHTEESLNNLDLSKLPYNCIEYMFKNHYDFFGLIEARLAVDIKL